MHMADALVSPAVGGVMLAVSAGAVVYAATKIKKDELDEKKVPLMGIMGAFVFAAQMINFTIPGTGSSGHIGGGILLAALLGANPAFLTITAVLIIQALFFGDGGLLALGCNIFNMGIIPCFLIYPLIFRPIMKKGFSGKNLSFASILAVMVGLELGAFSVVLETQFSGITELPFGTFVALMLPIHLAIGLVEGIVTSGVLMFVNKVRPEILNSAFDKTKLGAVSVKKVALILTIAAVVIGGGLSLLASAYPDGLEWSMQGVTGSTELESTSQVHDTASEIQESTVILPDYSFKSDSENSLGTSASGIIGGAMTLALAGAAGLTISAVKKRRQAKEA